MTRTMIPLIAAHRSRRSLGADAARCGGATPGGVLLGGRWRGWAVVWAALAVAPTTGCRSAPAATGAPASPAAPGGDGWLHVPSVPAEIQVPSGTPLLQRVHAVGAQIYVCGPGADGQPAWTLKAPDAKLFDDHGAPAGTHGAGPHWTALDGSTVRGKKIGQARAPRAGAISWLLIEATAHEGTGVLSRVRYVQRVDTSEGLAPPAGCDAAHAGTESASGYTADYYFYGG